MRQIVRSVGVLSFAKIMAAIYGALGLLFTPIFIVAGLVGALAGKGQQDSIGGVMIIVLAVLMPFIYGAMGFVAGALGALIYNLFAKWMGGIELELQPAPDVPAASLSAAGPQQAG